MKWRSEIVFSFFFLALVLLFIVISFGYPLRAAVGPLAAGIPAAVFLVVQIILDMKKAAKTNPKPLRATDDTLPRRNYVNAISWIIGFLASTYVLGILLVFPLFTLAYVRASGWSWRLSISLAAGVLVLLYGVFGYFLRVPLYEGILFQ